MSFKYIDITTWKRKKQYMQFSSFADPCYCVGVRLDVTHIVRLCKEKGLSFFPTFTFVLMKTLNSFEGFRMRLDADKRVLVYDKIDPSYTVAMPDNGYEIGNVEYSENFTEFYRSVKESISDTINGKSKDIEFNEDGRTDLVYLSSLPWVDAQTYHHPLPLGDHASLSIPRIIWGKFTEENNGYFMFFSVTANHILIDGYEMSMMLNAFQERLNSVDAEVL